MATTDKWWAVPSSHILVATPGTAGVAVPATIGAGIGKVLIKTWAIHVTPEGDWIGVVE